MATADKPGSLPSTAETLTCDPETKALSLRNLPLPVPSPSNDEHLIRVHAVALTNGELAWPEPATVTPHAVPGYEVSGVVVSAPGSSPFQPGTEIFARTNFDRAGSAREYSIATTAELSRKPENLTFEEAATVPLSALTAWQALFVHGGLAAPPTHRTGDGQGAASARASANVEKRVLVTAAAGGVGIWAIQLTKLAGVGHVVGTCGTSNVAFVEGLGADEVLDYREYGHDLSSAAVGRASGGTKYDLVIDGVGGETLVSAWRCVKPGGTIICIVMPAGLKKPDEGVEEGVQGPWFIVEADSAQLDAITVLLEEGTCKSLVDSVYPLTEYEKAFAKLQTGHVRGKVVLRVNN